MKSLSEIETTVKRASRAAGFSWGIAEEVGKSIRLSELFGFPGIRHLNQYYQNKKKENFDDVKLINKFKPNQVINFGSAGAIKKETYGIVECTKFYQRDMDVRGLLGFKLGETPFDNINEIINSNSELLIVSIFLAIRSHRFLLTLVRTFSILTSLKFIFLSALIIIFSLISNSILEKSESNFSRLLIISLLYTNLNAPINSL